MSVITEESTVSTGTVPAPVNPTPSPEAAPVVSGVADLPPASPVNANDTPTPEAAEVDPIQAYNDQLAQELGEADAPPAPADENEAQPEAEGEEATEETPETTEETPGETPAATTFKLGADVPIEEFNEQKAAYLETVEITPELQAIFERQEAELAQAREVTAEFQGLANKETIAKFGRAVNSVYETDIDPESGQPVVNAKPFVEFMRTELKNEYRPIAEAIFASDSTKYEGLSVVEELLVDTFGPDKATKMMAYGHTDAPLPVVPDNLQLPAGIDERNKEAFFRLPEIKKFEIQSLVNEIQDLTAEGREASEWRKNEIAADLKEKREKLDAELFAIESVQAKLDSDRETAARTARQKAENAAEFRKDVDTAYQADLFALQETFAADLAPRLTYADGDTQLSQARNLLSRISNALGFFIQPDGSFTEDPYADHYAKQLTEEGVKYDFPKGRDLLKAYYKASERLDLLNRSKASNQAIEIAKQKRNQIMLDIKAEQKQLLGQLSAKYVKSAGTNLEKQIDAVQKKKQAVIPKVNGKPDTKQRQRPVSDDIREYNRKIAAATGDELYEFHQG